MGNIVAPLSHVVGLAALSLARGLRVGVEVVLVGGRAAGHGGVGRAFGGCRFHLYLRLVDLHYVRWSGVNRSGFDMMCIEV